MGLFDPEEYIHARLKAQQHRLRKSRENHNLQDDLAKDSFYLTCYYDPERIAELATGWRYFFKYTKYSIGAYFIMSILSIGLLLHNLNDLDIGFQDSDSILMGLSLGNRFIGGIESEGNNMTILDHTNSTRVIESYYPILDIMATLAFFVFITIIPKPIVNIERYTTAAAFSIELRNLPAQFYPHELIEYIGRLFGTPLFLYLGLADGQVVEIRTMEPKNRVTKLPMMTMHGEDHHEYFCYKGRYYTGQVLSPLLPTDNSNPEERLTSPYISNAQQECEEVYSKQLLEVQNKLRSQAKRNVERVMDALMSLERTDWSNTRIKQALCDLNIPQCKSSHLSVLLY